MIHRRTIIAAAMTGVVMPVAAQTTVAQTAPTEDLAFRVARNGSDIGRHTVRFATEGGTLIVGIAVDIKVGFGPVTFYRYRLRATETWRDGVLVNAVGETNDDGKKDFVRAARQGNGLTVQGSAGPNYSAPPRSICASHWNRAELAAPMVNIQDGALLTFAVSSKGREQIVVRGQTIAAEHHVLDGKDRLEIWYDDRGVWSALRAPAKDGSTIDYSRI